MHFQHTFPILEHDNSPTAVLEPSQMFPSLDIPEHAVLCFFYDVIASLVQQHQATCIWTMRSELGPQPVYEIVVDGRRLAVVHPGVGAPLAAAFLEEMIAIGCRKFIACGGAGVLDSTIALGHVMVPRAAIRDEGTSYHYLPPGREVWADADAVAAIEAVLVTHQYPYLITKTWTTDGLYRETPAKVQKRRAEGCLSVEMEAATFFAVAQFRGVQLAHLLYSGDDVGASEWNSRHWDTHRTIREQLFWIAAEACLRL